MRSAVFYIGRHGVGSFLCQRHFEDGLENVRWMRKHRKVGKISRLFSKEQHPMKSGLILTVLTVIVHYAVSFPSRLCAFLFDQWPQVTKLSRVSDVFLTNTANVRQ